MPNPKKQPTALGRLQSLFESLASIVEKAVAPSPVKKELHTFTFRLIGGRTFQISIFELAQAPRGPSKIK